MRIKQGLLRQLRLQHGLTQQQAADRIGIDERTYRRYESGEMNRGDAGARRVGQWDLLCWIAAAYGLSSPEVLLDREGASESGTALQAPDRPFHPAWYVHREPEERRALQSLQGTGCPVVLQGPRGFGKATLLGYMLHRQAGQPGRVVRMDVGALGKDALGSLDHLLYVLGEHVLEAVSPGSGEALARAWQRPGSEKNKLTWLFGQHVLPTGPLVLCLDKTDRLHELSYHDDFFALLRGWAERASEPPWDRLRLLLTIATEPAYLDSIDHSSFFAMANPIELGEFSREQVQALAALHALRPTAGEIDALLRLVNGHPYLCRVICYEAALQGMGLGELLGEPDLGRRLFGHHLRHLRRWVEGKQLIGVVREVLADPGFALSARDYCLLYGQGLVSEKEPGRYGLRCPLYEEYFKDLCRMR